MTSLSRHPIASSASAITSFYDTEHVLWQRYALFSVRTYTLGDNTAQPTTSASRALALADMGTALAALHTKQAAWVRLHSKPFAQPSRRRARRSMAGSSICGSRTLIPTPQGDRHESTCCFRPRRARDRCPAHRLLTDRLQPSGLPPSLHARWASYVRASPRHWRGIVHYSASLPTSSACNTRTPSPSWKALSMCYPSNAVISPQGLAPLPFAALATFPTSTGHGCAASAS